MTHEAHGVVALYDDDTLLGEARPVAFDLEAPPPPSLAQARDAAAGKDVRVGGGVNVIQQYLRQRLIDEMHIAISPVLLGAGERLFEGVNLPALGYACTRCESSPLATHVVLARQ